MLCCFICGATEAEKAHLANTHTRSLAHKPESETNINTNKMFSKNQYYPKYLAAFVSYLLPLGTAI